MSYSSGVDVKNKPPRRPESRSEAARVLILRAAERLFAERGIEHVSLREIGVAAGQRNNSAVQYHFGTREELVRALYEDRLAPLDRRRRELLDRLDVNVGESGAAGGGGAEGVAGASG